MKRKLIQQMRTEWRNNLWMTVELVIVGVILWGIFSVFASLVYIHQAPEGIDFTDVYNGRLGYIPKDANTRKAYPDSLHNEWTDLATLIANLKSNPYIESIGTGTNAIPYNFNYSGCSIQARIGDSIQYYIGNLREMTPDMVRTLRITGVNGETSEQLAQMVEEGKWLISTHENSYHDNNPELWPGHEAVIGNDSTNIKQIGALIHGIRRNDYEPVFGGVLIFDDHGWPYDIAIRVKPGKGQEFMESLKADDLEFGNVYAHNICSIEDKKKEAHRDVSTFIRNMSACALFVMIAVFLGFLGSFWYRTQQRVPELALRKVNGATDADLFRRFIGEGLILLCVAAPFIIGIAAIVLTGAFNLFEIRGSVDQGILWAMIPATLAVLALMIAAGVWLPARKAMKINPAEALKDQ